MNINKYTILGIDCIMSYVGKNGSIGFKITKKNNDVKLEDGNICALEYINNAKYQFDSYDLNRDVCARVEDNIPLIEYLSSYTIK